LTLKPLEPLLLLQNNNKGGPTVMQTITIDEEFRSLLPTLDKETYAALEDNLITNGCRDALIIWNDILIDGYNRYENCSRLRIPYNIVSMDFDSREEVLIWIISNQVSRRNLTQMQLSFYRGLHYEADKAHRCQKD
jgi:hypothetical protein